MTLENTNINVEEYTINSSTKILSSIKVNGHTLTVTNGPKIKNTNILVSGFVINSSSVITHLRINGAMFAVTEE
jgi:hypothetical protein